MDFFHIFVTRNSTINHCFLNHCFLEHLFQLASKAIVLCLVYWFLCLCSFLKCQCSSVLYIRPFSHSMYLLGQFYQFSLHKLLSFKGLYLKHDSCSWVSGPKSQMCPPTWTFHRHFRLNLSYPYLPNIFFFSIPYLGE